MLNFNLHCKPIIPNWQNTSLLPPLGNNELHVWMFNTNEHQHRQEHLASLLSKDETERMNRYRKADDRLRFLFAQGYKRILCGHYVNQLPEQTVFDKNEMHKPHLVNDAQLHFNFSHSHNKVLFCFSRNTEVGCDVEYIRPQFNYKEFMHRFYSTNEIAEIENATHETTQRDLFFQFWSRKEGWLKATGIGIFNDLQHIDTALNLNKISIHNPHELLIKFRADFYLQSFASDDCRCSVVSNSVDEKIFFFEWND